MATDRFDNKSVSSLNCKTFTAKAVEVCFFTADLRAAGLLLCLQNRKEMVRGMLIAWLMLIIGLVLLVKGADWFVDSASGLAARFGISPLVIGLTIVAFGTSAPEAAVSITSSIKGSNGIAIGNIIGSNLFNLLVVVGASALIRPCSVDKSIIRKDFPFSILATVVLIITMLDKICGDLPELVISRSDGLIILAFFIVFMYYTVASAMSEKTQPEETQSKKPVWLLIVMLLVGITAVVLGGQSVVRGASDVARAFGVGESLIGMTIVAVGTSLPELVTSIVAVRKGEDNIAIGNVVGSNIFNLLFIVGMGAGISTIKVNGTMLTDAIALLAVNLLFYAYIARRRTVSRSAGAVMVAAYAVYMLYAVIR